MGGFGSLRRGMRGSERKWEEAAAGEGKRGGRRRVTA